jgi:transcriptional regulator with XRE-family HTH domain
MDPAQAFGKVVRELRLKAGLSQEKLGEQSDLRRTFVSYLELGDQQPTLITILKLAKGLGYSAKDLIGMTESELHRPYELTKNRAPKRK